MRYTLNELAAVTGGSLADPNAGAGIITSITTDSRNVPQGSLFVAVAGKFVDGHDFIEQAFSEGAVGALSEKDAGVKCGSVIRVTDTRRALLAIAENYIGKFDIHKVAVTGSVGKTTTKDMIAFVLSQKFATHKTPGSYNNDIGFPITIFEMPQDTQAAVLEMGMNHLREIAPMSRAAKPHIAVISNIGVAHIENLGSREGILKAKLEILEGLKPGGVALFNGDNDMLQTTMGGVNGHMPVFYGLEPHNRFRGENIVKRGIYGVNFTYVDEGTSFDINVPAPGIHMVYNALSAAAVGRLLGLSNEEIQRGIATYVPTGARMKISTTTAGITIMDDAYNANPDSVKASLNVLKEAEGRKVAVLGDMAELGVFAREMHEDVGRYAVAAGVDVLVCVGELSVHTYHAAENQLNARHFGNKSDAVDFLRGALRAGDTVLVKASRAAAFEEIVGALG